MAPKSRGRGTAREAPGIGSESAVMVTSARSPPDGTGRASWAIGRVSSTRMTEAASRASWAVRSGPCGVGVPREIDAEAAGFPGAVWGGVGARCMGWVCGAASLCVAAWSSWSFKRARELS